MRQTEIKVGLFVVFGGVTLVAALFWLSKVRFGSTFEIVFREVAGLEKGVPVRLAGVKIGDVTQIAIEEGQLSSREGGSQPQVVVQVTLSTPDIILPEPNRPLSRKPGRKYLYRSYRYLIAGGSLLGTKFITISARDKLGRPLPVSDDQILYQGGRVQGEDPVALEDVLGKLDILAQNIVHLLDETTKTHIREAIAELASTAKELRQLIQKTNRATGASGEKLVRIVSNVEQATAGFRQLVGDNQSQVQSLLTHLAQAAERLDQSLQRGAPDFQQFAKNLAATSASLRRVMDSNEENFSRLVRDVTGAAETVQRILQDNEREVHRMLVSWADTAAGLQQTLSQNKGKLTTFLENLEGLTVDLRQTIAANQGDLRAFTGNLAALSETMREGAQEVQENLKRTAVNLDQLTGNLNEMVASNQGNIAQILTDLAQASKSLTGIVKRLQTILEDERWAADLQHSLDAIRSTSEEAAETVKDLRSLLTDAELQSNLRGTMRNLEQTTAQSQRLLEKTNRVLSGDLLAGLGSPQWQMDLLYRPAKNRFRTDLNVRLHRPGPSFWQLGWEDVTEGDRLNLQYGLTVQPRQTWRAGLYRSKLGGGWEFEAGSGKRVVLDLFNPNEPQLNVRTYYRLRGGWQLAVGMEDLGGANDFIGGVRYEPEWSETDAANKSKIAKDKVTHGSHLDTEH